MSGPSPSSDYDLGYADGRRDGIRPAPDQFESHMQSATDRHRYEDGYVDGYLDRQDDELQIEFGLAARLHAFFLARGNTLIGPFRQAR